MDDDVTPPAAPLPLLRADHGPCAVLTLNRPAVLNAIDDGLLDRLDEALDALAHDTAVRALVLVGSGRAFCAGTDLSHGPDAPADAAEARVRRMHALIERLQAFPRPSVAALNGLALGGGLELALACTLRVAAPGVRLGLPEITLGLMPVYGGTALLPRLIGPGRALEMMLSGQPVTAEQALAWGLVNRVSATADGLLAEACALAHACSRYSAVPQRQLRRLVQEAPAHPTLAAALQAELDAAQAVFHSEDAQEGMAAFLAKRAPVFKDR